MDNDDDTDDDDDDNYDDTNSQQDLHPFCKTVISRYYTVQLVKLCSKKRFAVKEPGGDLY